MIIKNELIMKINFSLWDYDDKSIKFVNPRNITTYKQAISVNLSDRSYQNQITKENKIKLLNIKLDNIVKSFAINFESKKQDIIEKITEMVNLK